MKGKLAFLTGAAVGYVLGSRAGRARYEQIKRGAKKLWNTESVQRGVGLVRDVADERADDLKHVAQRVGSQVLGKLSEQMASSSSNSQSSEKNSQSEAAQKSSAKQSSTEGSARSSTNDQDDA